MRKLACAARVCCSRRWVKASRGVSVTPVTTVSARRYGLEPLLRAQHDVMAVQGSRTHADVNAVIGGYLRDLAFAQTSPQKMFGYKRAAAAILGLDVPLTDLCGPDG